MTFTRIMETQIEKKLGNEMDSMITKRALKMPLQLRSISWFPRDLSTGGADSDGKLLQVALDLNLSYG